MEYLIIHQYEGLRGKTIIVNIPKMFSIAVLKWDPGLLWPVMVIPI